MDHAVEGNSSAELAQYGELCHGRGVTKKCDEGLVCSPKTWTCKAALMFPCKGPGLKKMQCESDAYDRNIKCGSPDPDGTSYCCIKGSSALLPYNRQLSRRPYYEGSKIHGQNFIYHHKDCCSQLAEIRVSVDLVGTGADSYTLCK